MLKFLIIIFLVGYVIYKAGGVIFRVLSGNLNNGQYSRGDFQGQSNRPPRTRKGDVNIDHVPNDKKNRKGFDGGEYVDYEELK